MSFLSVKDLCVSYPSSGLKFVYNIEVEEGEIIGLFGQSGRGKTTFFRSICALEKIDSLVSLTLNNVDISKKKSGKRGIGYVFQDYAIFENLTVAGNLKFVLFANRVKHKLWKDMIRNSLEFVHLLPLLKQKSSTLSGGEKQRLALARSIIIPPKLLLLDEPFNSIDETVKSYITKKLKTLNQEKKMTIIIVSHNMDELSAVATRLVNIDEICKRTNLVP